MCMLQHSACCCLTSAVYLELDSPSVDADRPRPIARRPAIDRDITLLDSDRCRPVVKLRVIVPA